MKSINEFYRDTFWVYSIAICHVLKQLRFSVTFTDIFSCFNHQEENKIYQRYYQWISLVFVIQAGILYIPAYLWKISEGGLMHKICNKLDKLGIFLNHAVKMK